MFKNEKVITMKSFFVRQMVMRGYCIFSGLFGKKLTKTK